MLIECGVKKGDRVGIFSGPSLESAKAVFGIMKTGAAYVPLDPSAPAARNAFVINDCGIRLLVSTESCLESLKLLLREETGVSTIVGIDEDLGVRTVGNREIWQMAGDELNVRVLDDDPAYIMYTSGTTGEPKGIVHTHRSGLSYAKLSKELYQVNPEDRLGNHSPLHFDISTMGYFTMPLAGATTVIIPEAYKKFPASLSQLIEDEMLTIWYSVPLALIQLVQRGLLEKRDLKSLRWVLFGGEPFPSKHLRELMKAIPQATFSNVYGPAEINQCTYYHLSKAPAPEKPVPLGRVWDNTEILVVDNDDRRVVRGETGELLVRTATLMKGYWRRPELTKKTLFTRERVPGVPEVFYRTGDLVFENAKGDLVFMGRLDRQVKIRGYRIELDEIESVLTAHPHIEEAAVYVYEKNGDQPQIAARVVVKAGSSISGPRLQKDLGKYLPSYSAPSLISFSDILPRTAAGKIDHKEIKRQGEQEFKK